jgi:hypothetical protein
MVSIRGDDITTTNYAQATVQQQQKLFNPATMYRGVGVNCINMGSCTMIQFAVGGKLKQSLLSRRQPHASLDPRRSKKCPAVSLPVPPALLIDRHWNSS